MNFPRGGSFVLLVLNIFEALLQPCLDTLCRTERVSMSPFAIVSLQIPQVLLLGPLIPFLYALGLCIYRLTIHPYAKYPGPLLAKARQLAHIKGVS